MEEVKMSCCTMDDTESEAHDCCQTDHPISTKNDCGENGCPSNDCHFHQITTFHVFFPNHSEENESKIISSKKLKSERNKSLIIKDLSYSYWNPPKYIS